MLNDEQIAESVRLDMEHVRGKIPGFRDPDLISDLLTAVVEISKNSVTLAGRGHVPIPAQEIPDSDYAALLLSVISVNVRVFVGRPHSLEESEHLRQIHAAVEQLRIGADSAAA